MILQSFVDAIESLPEFDKPSYFGLPENIERSSQRMISQNVISQLRVLKRANVKATKFDKDVWAGELGPVLNLWKKLNQVTFDHCSIKENISRNVLHLFYFCVVSVSYRNSLAQQQLQTEVPSSNCSVILRISMTSKSNSGICL